MDYTFCIGSLLLHIRGTVWLAETIPFNFRPFVCHPECSGKAAAVLTVEYFDKLPSLPDTQALSSAYNDLGRVSLYKEGEGWLVAMVPEPGEYPRTMRIDGQLESAHVQILTDDPYANFVIDSMSRIFFAQFAALHSAFMLHASVVEAGGKAFLFMGKSGTGKSTHSRLWLECFDDCSLLNDDCPLVVSGHKEDRFEVCGTPWSGKTSCWRNACFPVAGIVRLRQADFNRFIPTEGIDSFVAFIPGMSVMTADKKLYGEALSTALRMLAKVPTGWLECLPNREAAVLCREALYKETI